MKHRKPLSAADDEMVTEPDDISPHPPNGINDLDMSDDDDLMLGKRAVVAETKEWQATIEKVVRNVVSIHFAQTCPFDTDGALTSEATGFVVDADRGYILTNRHVVGAGPFWGYCIFDNHEEVYTHEAVTRQCS